MALFDNIELLFFWLIVGHFSLLVLPGLLGLYFTRTAQDRSLINNHQRATTRPVLRPNYRVYSRVAPPPRRRKLWEPPSKTG